MDVMFKSYTHMQTGGDVWAFKEDIKIDTPLVFGEEFSYEMIGKECTELVTQTREGYISMMKMGEKVIVTKMKCGKQFQIAVYSLYFNFVKSLNFLRNSLLMDAQVQM